MPRTSGSSRLSPATESNTVPTAPTAPVDVATTRKTAKFWRHKHPELMSIEMAIQANNIRVIADRLDNIEKMLIVSASKSRKERNRFSSKKKSSAGENEQLLSEDFAGFFNDQLGTFEAAGGTVLTRTSKYVNKQAEKFFSQLEQIAGDELEDEVEEMLGDVKELKDKDKVALFIELGKRRKATSTAVTKPTDRKRKSFVALDSEDDRGSGADGDANGGGDETEEEEERGAARRGSKRPRGPG